MPRCSFVLFQFAKSFRLAVCARRVSSLEPAHDSRHDAPVQSGYPLLAAVQNNGLLANFIALTHNLRGVVIWGNHECIHDSTRLARWCEAWRCDPGNRIGDLAGNRVVLYRRRAASLHGRCLPLVRLGNSRCFAGGSLHGQAADRAQSGLPRLFQTAGVVCKTATASQDTPAHGVRPMVGQSRPGC
jgi:hypothetical protein